MENLKYLVCLDVEATCWESDQRAMMGHPLRDKMEIIGKTLERPTLFWMKNNASLLRRNRHCAREHLHGEHRKWVPFVRAACQTSDSVRFLQAIHRHRSERDRPTEPVPRRLPIVPRMDGQSDQWEWFDVWAEESECRLLFVDILRLQGLSETRFPIPQHSDAERNENVDWHEVAVQGMMVAQNTPAWSARTRLLLFFFQDRYWIRHMSFKLRDALRTAGSHWTGPEHSGLSDARNLARLALRMIQSGHAISGANDSLKWGSKHFTRGCSTPQIIDSLNSGVISEAAFPFGSSAHSNKQCSLSVYPLLDSVS